MPGEIRKRREPRLPLQIRNNKRCQSLSISMRGLFEIWNCLRYRLEAPLREMKFPPRLPRQIPNMADKWILTHYFFIGFFFFKEHTCTIGFLAENFFLQKL